MRGLHDLRILDSVGMDVVYSLEVLATGDRDQGVEVAISKLSLEDNQKM